MTLSDRGSGVRELHSVLSADFGVNPYWADRMTLAVLRLGQAAHGRRGVGAFVVRRLHGTLDALWTRSVIGGELPRSVVAGPGLHLPHSGRGVVLHPSTVLGSGVTLYHRVTVGVQHGSGTPRIGDGVLLGAGAAVLGDISIGHGARVGANAVVLRDVAAGVTVVGVPARVRSEPA